MGHIHTRVFTREWIARLQFDKHVFYGADFVNFTMPLGL